MFVCTRKSKLGGAVELTGDLFVTGNLTIGDGFKGIGTIIVGGDLIVRGDDPLHLTVIFMLAVTSISQRC